MSELNDKQVANAVAGEGAGSTNVGSESAVTANGVNDLEINGGSDRQSSSSEDYSTASVSNAFEVMLERCNEKALDTFLKRVAKWGDAKDKEIEESSMDRDTYEFTQYRDFRSLTETMFATLKLQSGQIGNGITIQALFRDKPEGAMFDTLIVQDPDDQGQVGTRARMKIRLAPALDDFVFGAISLRLGGERLRTFKTACGSDRVIKGLRALSTEFTINQENVQRRTRLALQKLKLGDDVGVARFVTHLGTGSPGVILLDSTTTTIRYALCSRKPCLPEGRRTCL